MKYSETASLFQGSEEQPWQHAMRGLVVPHFRPVFLFLSASTEKQKSRGKIESAPPPAWISDGEDGSGTECCHGIQLGSCRPDG